MPIAATPQEWPLVRLDEIASRGSGHTPSKRHPDYWAGSIPWVSLADTGRLDQQVVWETTSTITEAGLAHSAAVLHPAGTVILLRGSSVGKSAILGADMAVSQDYVTWTCGARLDAWFLYYLLQSRKREFARIGFGNTIKTIGLDYFRNLAVPLPSIGEQRRISDAMRSIDGDVMSLERLIAKKQAIKRGMMQQLLTGRTRLPGYHAKWTPQQLDAVLDKLESGVSVNSVPDSGRIRVLKTSCVSGGEFDASESKTVAPSNIYKVKTSPRTDTLIISRMNTPALVGEVGYVDAEFPTLFLPDRLWLATRRDAQTLDMRWLAYVLSSAPHRDRLKELATGTSGSMKNIARSAFLELTLPFPSKDEQTAIATVLADADREITALQGRLAKVRDIKTGMMQQLLTGRTRLPIPEAAA